MMLKTADFILRERCSGVTSDLWVSSAKFLLNLLGFFFFSETFEQLQITLSLMFSLKRLQTKISIIFEEENWENHDFQPIWLLTQA